MPTEDALFRKKFIGLARCLFLVLVICPGYLSAKVTITASKDCSTSPCTVVDPGPFTTVVPQNVTWSATYTGIGGPGNPEDFWISSGGQTWPTYI